MIRFVFFAFAWLVAASAQAAVLQVPGDYATPALASEQAQAGDEISIAEGTYAGAFVLTQGVTLRGAGAGVTILESPGEGGALLQSRGAEGLDVSGITFRHTGEYAEDAGGDLDLVWIEGGSARFEGCAFEGAWESGLYVFSGAQVDVANCLFTDSELYGCYVRDEGSRLTLTDSTAATNYSGVCVSEGGHLHAERVNSRENTQEGFNAFAGSARLEAIDCLAEANGGSGFRAEDYTNVDLTGCRALANGEEGGYFFGSVQTMIVDCAFDDNKDIGLRFLSCPTPASVLSTSISRNAGDGLWLNSGSVVVVKDCVIEENGGCGIYAFHWETRAEVSESRIAGNGWLGAFAESGAGLRVSGSTIESNREHGLYWKDAGTTMEESGNTYVANASGTVLHEPGLPAHISDQVWPSAIAFQFVSGEFERLEAYAARLREARFVTPEGGNELDAFYESFEEGYWYTTPQDEEIWDEQLLAYINAYPESITPRLVQANAIIQRAWNTEGWGDELAEDSEEVSEYLALIEQATLMLKVAEAMTMKDARLYDLWLTAEMAAYTDASSRWDLLRKGQAIDPAYYPMYSTMAYGFLPSWAGDTDAMEEVADALYEAMGEEAGARYYAVLAGEMSTWLHAWYYAEGGFLDWERIDRGFTAQRAMFPDTNGYLNEHAWLACMYGDQERAMELFAELDGEWAEYVWQDRSVYRAWEQWALGAGSRPPLPDGGDIAFADAFVLGFAGGDRATLIFFAVMFGVTVAATLSTVVVFIVLRIRERRA